MQWLAQDVEHLVSLSQAADNPYCPDVVVVGSGYGGAVAALRFAEHGQSVALLERGNEYLAGEFPSDLSQTGGFIRAELHANQGANTVGNEDALFDFRLGQRASALVGNGLGGGSLINAAVALRPDPRVFAHSPWPEAIRQADLDEDFQRAGAGLQVQTPATQAASSTCVPQRKAKYHRPRRRQRQCQPAVKCQLRRRAAGHRVQRPAIPGPRPARRLRRLRQLRIRL